MHIKKMYGLCYIYIYIIYIYINATPAFFPQPSLYFCFLFSVVVGCFILLEIDLFSWVYPCIPNLSARQVAQQSLPMLRDKKFLLGPKSNSWNGGSMTALDALDVSAVSSPPPSTPPRLRQIRNNRDDSQLCPQSLSLNYTRSNNHDRNQYFHLEKSPQRNRPNNGSYSCPKPSSSSSSSIRSARKPFFEYDDRPATASGQRSSPLRDISTSLFRVVQGKGGSSSPIQPSPSPSWRSLSPDRKPSGHKPEPTRTRPSAAAATTQLLHKAEFQKNIGLRSHYWKKYRVVMPHSNSHDVLALAYTDRKHWNDKHKIDVCSTHLTKCEYEVRTGNQFAWSFFLPCCNLINLLCILWCRYFGSGLQSDFKKIFQPLKIMHSKEMLI